MKKKLLLVVSLFALTTCLSACGLLNQGQSSSDGACEHVVVKDAAVAPTCKETGLTAGEHCSVCGEVLLAQEKVEKLAHTEVIDAAIAPTCSGIGLSEGKHCSVCKEVLIAQEVVPAMHSFGEWEDVVLADCFFDGEQKRGCTVCGEEETQTVAKLSHSFVQNEETLLYACEYCDAQVFNGHLYAAIDVEVDWYDAYKICEDLGGYLVTITSADEQTFVENYNRANSCTERQWLGAYRTATGFQWITDEPFTYTNWHAGDPTNSQGRESVAELYSYGDGQWNDCPPLNNFIFICEWESAA